ncbi:MAG: TetR/AcrR family transcriptional regulator [Methylocystis sp.]
MAKPTQHPPKSRRDQTRERVLTAAAAVISTKGLAGLKARDIAARAGCALGAIYTVFEDLDEVILAVNQRTLARIEAALAAGERAEGEAELQRLAHAYLAYARGEEPRWRALFEHRLPPEKPLPDWFEQDRDRLFGLAEAPLERLLPDEEPAARKLRARTLFSAVHGVVLLGLEEKLAPTSVRMLESQLTDFVATMARGLTRK